MAILHFFLLNIIIRFRIKEVWVVSQRWRNKYKKGKYLVHFTSSSSNILCSRSADRVFLFSFHSPIVYAIQLSTLMRLKDVHSLLAVYVLEQMHFFVRFVLDWIPEKLNLNNFQAFYLSTYDFSTLSTSPIYDWRSDKPIVSFTYTACN